MNPQNFTRMDLSRRLIRVARPVLFPLVFSLLARIVALVLGIALFAVGTWALGSYASDPASVTLSWVVWALVIMSLLKACSATSSNTRDTTLLSALLRCCVITSLIR